MGVAFVLSVLYARYLTKATYGDYRYVLSLLSVFGILTLPGIGTALTRAVSRGALGSYHRAHRAFLYSSLSVAFFGIIASIWYASLGNINLSLSLLVGSVLIPFVEGMGNWRALLDGMKRYKEKALYNSIIKFVYGVVMGGAVLWSYIAHTSSLITLLMLVGIYYGVHGVANIILSAYAQSLIPRDAPHDTETIRYGTHLSLAGIFATFATYIDGVLIYNLLGPESLATYSFAIAPPEQLKSLLANTATVSYTKLSEITGTESGIANLQQTLPKKVFRATLLSTLIITVYIIASPTLFAIFLPKYLPSIHLSQAFALSLILFPFGIFHTVITAIGNLKTVYLDGIISPIIQIVCLIIFVPLWGLWGAIIARIVGRFFNHIIAWALFQRLTPHTPNPTIVA